MIIVIIFLGHCTISNSQNRFSAILSTKGDVYYTLNLDGFSVSVDSYGGLLGYSGSGNEKISYDHNGRISILGDKKISWDYHDRIDSIGNVKIQYDPISHQLTAVGGLQLTYDFLSKKIISIDKQPIQYDFISKKVVKIASAAISYNFDGYITGIEDKENIIMLRSSKLSKN